MSKDFDIVILTNRVKVLENSVIWLQVLVTLLAVSNIIFIIKQYM